MLVVLPVCGKDFDLALQHVQHWVGKKVRFDHDALIAAPSTFDASLIVETSKKLFRSAKLYTYEDWRGDLHWPHPQNWSFQRVAYHLGSSGSKDPWLWLEPDAVLLRKEALDVLDQAYTGGHKQFAGHVVTSNGHPYMAGVGIYPPDVLSHLSRAMLCRGQPFDVVASVYDGILKKTLDISRLIHHTVKPRQFQDRKSVDELIDSGAVVFHKCKDGSILNFMEDDPVRSRLISLQAPTTTYYHSGDLGDVIYSLPTMKALGGGVMMLGPDNRSGMKTRVPLLSDRAATIIPLLERQPYITRCEYRHTNPGVTHDLNDFRLELTKGQLLDCKPGYNLARVPLKHWGFPLDLDLHPWLDADPKPKARVVISRSSRYQNKDFDWQRIVRTYRADIVFVGLKDEHNQFCSQFGKVPYLETANLLDLAEIIAGCELFIGNQSCPYAIAVGLGCSTILEVCNPVSNCIFPRTNIIHGCTPSTTLPALSYRPKRDYLQIRAPIDTFTGIGQMVVELCNGLDSAKRNFFVAPLSMDERLAPVPKSIKSRVNKSVESDLLITPLLACPERLQGGEVLLTMWESSKVPENCVAAINQKAEAVIVPTQWGASCMVASGVRVPVRVVPLGIDPNIYSRKPFPNSRPFRFGAAARMAHGGTRKGVEEVVDCFCKTFPVETDVELQIKLFSDCTLPRQQDKRITVIRQFIAEPEMVAWYESLHCFVSLTKGEGWGLHIHQAMAIGRPVIAARATGQSEFMTEDNAMCCRFKFEQPSHQDYRDAGAWCVPDLTHASELMREAYENPVACQKLGKLASSSASAFTWERFVAGVEEVLTEFHRL